jgi:hypothetical protein
MEAGGNLAAKLMYEEAPDVSCLALSTYAGLDSSSSYP